MGYWACGLWFVVASAAALSTSELGVEEQIAGILADQGISALAREEVRHQLQGNVMQGLEVLDPYARYLPPDQVADRRRQREVGKVGIGAQLLSDPWGLLIIPLPGGPIDAAGLARRGYLKAVDGQSVEGWTPDRVAAALNGQAGSRVRITVVQGAGGPPLDLTVVRRQFRAPSLSLRWDGDIAYLKVWSFRRRETAVAMRRGLQFLAAQGSAPVIDLRDAQGGDYYEALDCAALFLAGGSLLGVLEDHSGTATDYTAPASLRISKRWPILLTAGATASAAEAFAAALRFNDAAVLVGAATYGKCLSQTEVPLRNGGVLRFSNRRMVWPGGRRCEPGGLLPDVEVDDPEYKSVTRLMERYDRG